MPRPLAGIRRGGSGAAPPFEPAIGGGGKSTTLAESPEGCAQLVEERMAHNENTEARVCLDATGDRRAGFQPDVREGTCTLAGTGIDADWGNGEWPHPVLCALCRG